MKKTMRNIHRLLRYNHSIEYQKSNPSERWNHFHIVLSEKEYEYFIDMRKLCKRSVSFLVALSVNKYIEEVIAELTNIKTEKTDNYQFLSYILIGERIDNVISWRIYWDLPRKGMRLAKK
ncbi:MAG: hypothetical protein JXA20_16305 [Spirochaetes bacterium]|nr:hypothetical protein [Spirochaetota bacterium]